MATSSVRNDRVVRRKSVEAAARHLLPGGFALVLSLMLGSVQALSPGEAGQSLRKADDLKTARHAEFHTTLHALEGEASALSPDELQYLHFLEGFEAAYHGDYNGAVTRLQTVINDSRDELLRFRAGLMVVNILGLSARYEQALSQLSRLLAALPQVSDKAAREQANVVAALVYNEMGQYELGLSYAQRVIDEKGTSSGVCKASQMKLEALSKEGRLEATSREFETGIDACMQAGELLWANIIRTYEGQAYIREGRLDEALKLLSDFHDEARRIGYPRLTSAFDALLAETYQRKGAAALAKQFALEAVDAAVKDQYTEPLVTAYRVLYEVEKDQGDFRSALKFLEQYAAADKGYLDHISAQQLAYQKVNHENIANRLQIDALSKQNNVLQLQRQLSAKAVETSRLYIALLALTLVFIALWAYKTKRSQLHFMSLSQLDGLTGISNRPYFIEQAERALEYSRRMGQDGCMILCDLDYFKTVNDRHGHATGDSVLRRMVSACKPHMRKSDIFGRVGGEEFAIFLPGCGLEEGRQRSEELRATIAAIIVEQNGGGLTVSASFGVAATSTSGYQLRELLAHADTALYEAKRAGRNRVVLYGSMRQSPDPADSAVSEPLTRPGRRYMPT